jgi:hypothetical protein
MKVTKRGAWVAVIAALAIAAPAVAIAATSAISLSASSLSIVKGETGKFQDLSVAKKAGYGLLKDKKGISCIAMDPMPGMAMGAMGVHYANPSLVGDGKLDLHSPEALVYQPVGGKLRLGALEYVVIKKAWDAVHNGAPVMFGHRFNLTPEGNRFGLPAFYSLHVWLFKQNPAGEFAMWNPRVSCAGVK